MRLRRITIAQMCTERKSVMHTNNCILIIAFTDLLLIVIKLEIVDNLSTY